MSRDNAYYQFYKNAPIVYAEADGDTDNAFEADISADRDGRYLVEPSPGPHVFRWAGAWVRLDRVREQQQVWVALMIKMVVMINVQIAAWPANSSFQGGRDRRSAMGSRHSHNSWQVSFYFRISF